MLSKQQQLTIHLQEIQYINPSYQIYGGLSGFQDYGILGTRLKNNLIKVWKDLFVNDGDNVEEIETPVIMNHALLKASGHVEKFDDFIVYDNINKKDIRADHLVKRWFKDNNMPDMVDMVESFDMKELEDNINKYKMLGDEIVKVRRKNLMFGVGDNVLEPDYLRPEIAQAMFSNFREVNKFLQKDLPLGIAQVGKSFRKEISPEQFTRLREFNQAELEYFFDPTDGNFNRLDKYENVVIPLISSDMQLEGDKLKFISIEDAINQGIIKNIIMAYFLAKIFVFSQKIGLHNDKIRFRQHLPNEMAHYASECWDLECFVNGAWLECVGCANRGSYDLEAHAKGSGQKLTVKKELKEPIIKEQLKISIKKGIIAKKFKELTPNIVKVLEGMTQDDIIGIGDEIVIGDCVIDSSMFVVEKDIVKILFEEFYPHVIEPSFGIDRLIYSVFEHNFWLRDETRIVMSLPVCICPYVVAVFPLMKKNELVDVAVRINKMLGSNRIKYFYDNSSTKIGKKYVRSDEIGINFALTIDYETLDDDCVTVRDRDDMVQVRVKIDAIVGWLWNKGAC